MDAESTDGRQFTMRSKPSSDIKSALGSARAMLVSSFTLGSNQPEPIPAIFPCAGNATKSDGTCNDVIAACATIDEDLVGS